MIVCYFCIFRGVKLSGKIAIYTSSLPYVLLTILFLRYHNNFLTQIIIIYFLLNNKHLFKKILNFPLKRGILLPGSLDGLKFLFTPKVEKIFKIECWIDALN